MANEKNNVKYLDANSEVLDFGAEGTEVAGVGSLQPSEAPFAVNVGALKLATDGDKKFIEVPWTIVADPLKTGDVGKGRLDRLYLPHAGQTEDQRNTSMQFIVRFARSCGKKTGPLKGKLTVAKIIDAYSNAKDVPIFYSPHIAETKSHKYSNTSWLLADERDDFFTGKLTAARKVVAAEGKPGFRGEKGKGNIADDALGAEDNGVGNAGTVSNRQQEEALDL